MRYFIVMMFLLVGMPAHALDLGECFRKAPVSEWTFQATNVLDKVGTAICLDKGTCRERNFLLGKNPSKAKLGLATVVAGASHFAGTCYIGQRYGYDSKTMFWWQIGTNIGQGYLAGASLSLAF